MGVEFADLGGLPRFLGCPSGDFSVSCVCLGDLVFSFCRLAAGMVSLAEALRFLFISPTTFLLNSAICKKKSQWLVLSINSSYSVKNGHYLWMYIWHALISVLGDHPTLSEQEQNHISDEFTDPSYGGGLPL